MSKTKTTEPALNSTQGKIQPTTEPALNLASDEIQPAAETSSLTQGEITPQTPQEAPESAGNAEQDQDLDQGEALATVTAERDALRLQVARLTVAGETGVPADLLTADTDEGMREQAEKLIAYAETRKVRPDFGGGNRGEAVRDDTDPLRRLIGR